MEISEAAPMVNAFFQSYRLAFEQRDAPAIAGHFAYPGHMASDMGHIVLGFIDDKENWTGRIQQLLEMYRAIDVASARVVDMTMMHVSPLLLQARVHWELDDSHGRVLYDFLATYTLVTVEDTLRIAAIAHNEIPQYRACLARLRSRRSADKS